MKKRIISALMGIMVGALSVMPAFAMENSKGTLMSLEEKLVPIREERADLVIDNRTQDMQPYEEKVYIENDVYRRNYNYKETSNIKVVGKTNINDCIIKIRPKNDNAAGRFVYWDIGNGGGKGYKDFDVSLPVNGDVYTISIEAINSKGNVEFAVYATENKEDFHETRTWGSNNTRSTANPVKLNKEYKALIAVFDEEDYYSFKLNSAQVINVDLAYKNYYNLNIDGINYSIVDKNGNTVSTLKRGSNRVNLSSGTYYLRLYAAESTDATGTVTFKITGKENAETKNSIKSVSAKNMKYSGKMLSPSITVKGSDGKVLKTGVDYTVSYSPSTVKNVGIYTAKIKGKGNYSGTVSTSFYVLPRNVEISTLKAVSKGFTLNIKEPKTEIKGYEIQYSTNSKMTGASKVRVLSKEKSKTVTGLKKGTKYYVRVRSYAVSNGIKFFSPYSKTKTVTVK